MGKTIDADELLKRIEKMSAWGWDAVSMKWRIYSLIKKMAKEQTDDK